MLTEIDEYKKEYIFESPIISSTPVRFYDPHITKNMGVEEIWFGYGSYKLLNSRLEVITGNGWIEFCAVKPCAFQVTVKLVEMSEIDRVHVTTDIHENYHPHKGDNFQTHIGEIL